MNSRRAKGYLEYAWTTSKDFGGDIYSGDQGSDFIATTKSSDFNDEESIDCAAYICKAVNNRKRLVSALEKILKGEGRYSQDPLTHAGNTIEDMKEIAREALLLEKEKE